MRTGTNKYIRRNKYAIVKTISEKKKLFVCAVKLAVAVFSEKFGVNMRFHFLGEKVEGQKPLGAKRIKIALIINIA